MPLETIVDGLRHIRTHYGGTCARRRRTLLQNAAAHPVDDARLLCAYHDLLLFARAFPDDETVERLAEAELARTANAARAMVRNGRRRDLRILAAHGIAHAEIVCRPSAAIAAWLAARYPKATEIAWEDGSAGSGLEDMLQTVVTRAEQDGVFDPRHTTQSWMALARGPRRRAGLTDLGWLLRHFDELGLEPLHADYLFELFELDVRWRLTHRAASRTFQRLPRGPRHYQRTPLLRGADLADILARPLSATKPQSPTAAGKLIDVARGVLAVRHRETEPVTYAAPRDVTRFDLGRGVSVVLFGQLAERRLPLNAYYGFVMARNDVPLAYGGGWMFFDRCEIGINVFDGFRGGESAFHFAQLLRLYRGHFNVRRFTVEPYQFGAGNPEAIRSGAFWFYYRLGFRPLETNLAALAAREWQRLHADADHRTSAHTLRRLAGSFLELDIDADRAAPRFEPADVSLVVTRWIGERFDGDRAAARAWSRRHVRRSLGAGPTARWTAAERRAFDDFSLLVAPIPALSAWPARDRRALAGLMRAKGGSRERNFALRLVRHVRLRDAWAALVHDLER